MRELFESTAERLLGDLVDPAAIAAAESGAWPAKLWDAVEENGLPLAMAPEERGGAGATWSEAFVIVRAAGRHAAPIPLAETLLANWLLGEAGLEALSGPIGLAVGDELKVDGGKVSGRLAGVPWGRSVETVVTVAGGQVLLLNARDAAVETGLNAAREPRDALTFSGVSPIAAGALPHYLDAEAALLGGAMIRAGQMAGAMHRILDLSTTYANERVQFGRPIGKFQAIQHQIAVLSEHASLTMAGADTAFATARRGLSPFHVAVAKSVAGEAAGAGASIAHAVHGAIGFTYEHSLHYTTRRLWAWRSEFGSQSFWAQRLGRAAAAAGSPGLWPAITRGAFAP
jgi:acyl-CoA dehydrogenase